LTPRPGADPNAPKLAAGGNREDHGGGELRVAAVDCGAVVIGGFEDADAVSSLYSARFDIALTLPYRALVSPFEVIWSDQSRRRAHAYLRQKALKFSRPSLL
jgi:hypothetical protein